MSESEEENCEETSEEEISNTESIIREKSKVFINEKDAVRILLSDHFRKFTTAFFSNVTNTHNSVYQGIKQEIRNCLNPYRIWLKNKKNKLDNEKELKDLYEALKQHYKEKNFNNVFFINYFTDLFEAQKKQSKSKFVKFLPKNEIETLNDIHRKVMIIKRLKNYLNTTIKDRIQINFEQSKDFFDNNEFIMMFQYLVINKDQFSKLNEKGLIENLITKKSQRFRRPLNDNNYNYLPIFCKGHCKKEAQLFIQNFEKELILNHNNCKDCLKIRNNFENIKSQIKSLYLKTCIFSHNIEEINFHPLFFLSFENNSFYKSEFQKSEHNKKNTDLIITNNIPKVYLGKREYQLRKIYNENEEDIQEIFHLLKNFSNKINLFGNSCFMPEIKTKICPLDLFKPNKEDLIHHMKKCPYYHNELEKRRTIKIVENKICPSVKDENNWKTDISSIKCKDGDNCKYFHTRNELFYDQRNYRKLYTCNKEYFKFLDSKYFCIKGDICPRKHPIDIKIEEIYLPSEQKNELRRELNRLKEKEKKFISKYECMKKVECNYCLNYIDGNGRNFVFFRNCHHIICTKCYDLSKSCPLCGFKKDEDMVIIHLDIENNNDVNKSNDEEIEQEEHQKNKSEKEDFDESEENVDDEEGDNDLNDSDDKNDLNEQVFKANQDNYFNQSYHDSSIPDITMVNNINNPKNDDKEDENSSSLSNPSFNESNIRRERGGRGNNRGRGGRGNNRGRGGRVYRGRGMRGKGYYKNVNNTFEDDSDDSEEDDDNREDINNSNREENSMRYNRGRGRIRGRGRGK